MLPLASTAGAAPAPQKDPAPPWAKRTANHIVGLILRRRIKSCQQLQTQWIECHQPAVIGTPVRERSPGNENGPIYFDQAGALVLGGRIKGNLPTRAAYSITGNAGLYLHTARTND